MSQASMVRMKTALGIVDIHLFDEQAPVTVTNFLNYVARGDYDGSMIHRSVPGFIIQGGGYIWDRDANAPVAIPTDAPIVNEFDIDRSNVRGTIAMAKVGGDPDSATSQWFFNLADNSANLDNQNGGFTVFGEVTGAGMQVIDAIADLDTIAFSELLSELPVILDDTDASQAYLITLDSARLLPSGEQVDASDRVFNYLEAVYPQYADPPDAISATADPYYYRYYANTDIYVGTADGMLYYMGPSTGYQVIALGALAEWLEYAASAGY